MAAMIQCLNYTNTNIETFTVLISECTKQTGDRYWTDIYISTPIAILRREKINTNGYLISLHLKSVFDLYGSHLLSCQT